MSRVRSDNYIVIQGWMLNELNLKGNELMIYAIIYGFSQNEDNKFTGTLQYLADWTNSTKQGVSKCLKSLVEKKLIIKEDIDVHGVKFCHYYVTRGRKKSPPPVDGGMQQSLIPPNKGIQQSCTTHATKFNTPMQQSLTNNIDNNNIVDTLKDIYGAEEKKTCENELDKSPENEIIKYTDNDELKQSITEYIKMRKAQGHKITIGMIKILLKKLSMLTTDDNQKIDIVDTATINAWKEFYPIKKSESGNSGNFDTDEFFENAVRHSYAQSKLQLS